MAFCKLRAVLHAELARRNPNGLALDDGVRTRTWAELADRAARLANWIGALGARPGDHVAVLMSNRVECIVHASGKLYLRKLRDPYWAARSRRI